MAKKDKRLHIAMLIDDFYPSSGGIGRSVQTQIDELMNLGHKVTLLAPRHQLEKPSTCQTIVVPSLYIPGTPAHLCSLKYSGKRAKKIASENSFDIVHSHTERGALLLGSRIASELGVPHIHTFHANLAGTHSTTPVLAALGSLMYLAVISPAIAFVGKKRFGNNISLPPAHSDALSKLERFDWRSFAMIASRVDAYTSPATFMIERINECFAGLPETGTAIPTGVNSRFAQAVSRKQHPKKVKGSIRFLSVCRLAKEKRVDVLIEAFKAAAIPNSQLDIVGDGDQFDNLKKLSKDHRNIVFHRHISDIDKLAEIYATADVFVLPSYKFDTQAITLAEAVVAGLPILYCDDRLHVGVEKNNSVLAKNPSHTGIAEGLMQFTDAKKRLAMAKASSALAPKLTASRTAESYTNLYNQMINNFSL